MLSPDVVALVKREVSDRWKSVGPVLTTMNGGGGASLFPYDVRNFGVRGDFVFDDTASAQRALTAAGLVGGTVYFPKPIVAYRLTAPLVYGSNITICGDGAGSLLKLAPGIAATVKVMLRPIGSDVTGTVIRDIAFDQLSGTYSNNGQSPCVSVDQTIGVTLERVAFQNIQTMAVWCDSTVAHPCKQLRVVGCTVNGSEAGGVSLFGQIFDSRITDNHITNCKDDAIALQDSVNGRPVGCVVSGNTLRDNILRLAGSTPHGILIYGCKTTTVVGNTVDGSCAGGIMALPGSFNNCQNISVTGNTIINAGITSASTIGVPGSGINALSVTGLSITGNSIENSRGASIIIVGCVDFVVSGNSGRGSTNEACSVGTGCSDGVISDNVFTDPGNVSNPFGILFDCAVAAVRVRVRGNSVRDTRGGVARTMANAIYATPGSIGAGCVFESNTLNNFTASALGGTIGTLARFAKNDGYNPVGASAIVVTASPMTYTAGTSDEVVSVMGGTVSLVTKGGVNLATATNAIVSVPAGQSIVVTYSVAPTMTRDIQ